MTKTSLNEIAITSFFRGVIEKVGIEIIGCPPFKVVVYTHLNATFLFPYVIVRIKKNKTDLL